MTDAPRLPLPFKIALVANTAIGPAATQLFVPSVPAIAVEFGVAIGVAQISFSASMVALAISTLFYGPLSDRYGRLPMLYVGLALFLIGTAVSLFSTDITMLIGGRIIQAMGGAAGMVITRAIVRDIYGPVAAARVLGTLIVATIGAPMLSIVLGGLITDLFGWRWIFGVSLGLGLAVAALAWATMRGAETKRATVSSVADMVRGYGRLFGSPVFVGFILQGGFGAGSFFAFMAVGPFLMVEVLHRPATEFGAYFALVTLVFMSGNFVGGRLSSRVGLERMVVIGGIAALVCAAVGVGAFAVFGLGVAVMFGTSFFISFGNGLAMPNSQAGALNVIPELAGTASGAAAFVQTIFGAAFAQVVAMIIDPSGTALFAAMLFAMITALICGSIPLYLKSRAASVGGTAD
ncbi:MAG: multidrug effflux MFS transporter [Alphaproteobacteria bacterium]|nr:multidrug effflux MFS transporter [Alphaproteobacteria bacterium]